MRVLDYSITARKKRWGVQVGIDFIFAETSLLEREIELESCVMPVRQSIATTTFSPNYFPLHLVISSLLTTCLRPNGIYDPSTSFRLINSRTNHISRLRQVTSHVFPRSTKFSSFDFPARHSPVTLTPTESSTIWNDMIRPQQLIPNKLSPTQVKKKHHLLSSTNKKKPTTQPKKHQHTQQ